MISFILGVVVGAAFAPFWINMWNKLVASDAFKKFKLFVKDIAD